jgi:hypothetical protein
MAFQVDYSPLNRAAENRSQMLTGLGGQIGGAIEQGKAANVAQAKESRGQELFRDAIEGDDNAGPSTVSVGLGEAGFNDFGASASKALGKGAGNPEALKTLAVEYPELYTRAVSILSGEKGQRLAGLAIGGDEAAQDELAYTSPEISAAVMERVGAKSEQQQKGLIADFGNAYSMSKAGDHEGVTNLFDQRIAAVEARGGDASDTKRAKAIYEKNPENGAKFLESSLLRMINPKGFADKLGGGMDADGNLKVGAQEILEDGSIIQSTDRGPVVYDPKGKKVTGQAAADTVLAARAEKVNNLRKAAGEKKTAALKAELELKGDVEANVINKKEAAKLSVKAYEAMSGVNEKIGLYGEAIQAIDDGAETGAIISKYPSIKESAVELDNVQARLGLNVIQNTTFGSLSEQELKFALSTAVPQGLEGPALKEWLVQRRDAQTKLADYLESAAIYLGQDGHTLADWMVKKKEERASAAPVVASQADYDNIPSGAEYTEDGQLYRKP